MEIVARLLTLTLHKAPEEHYALEFFRDAGFVA